MENKTVYAKLLAVQKAVQPIAKDSVNPHFKNRYFDINSVLSELRPKLSEAGLVVTQPLTAQGIVTRVTDADTGETLESAFPLPDIQDPQKMGAAITYYRRYSLVSLFCLEADDDDGNSAKPEPKVAHADVAAAVSLCSTVDALNGLYAQLNVQERAKWKPEFTKRRQEIETKE